MAEQAGYGTRNVVTGVAEGRKGGTLVVGIERGEVLTRKSTGGK